MNQTIIAVLFLIILCCVIAVLYKRHSLNEHLDNVPPITTAPPTAPPPIPTSIILSNDNGDLLHSKSADFFNIALPKGIIIAFGGNTAPNGWVLCDGNNKKSINNITIPDLRGKFIYGKPPNKELLDSGGVIEHTLLIDEIPNHTHEFESGRNIDDNPGCHCGSGSCNCNLDDNSGMVIIEAGGGKPHNNLPPFVVLSYIIKVT